MSRKSNKNRQVRKTIRKRGGRMDASHIEEQHPNMKFCWMNNESSRIAEAQLDGWKPYVDSNAQSFDRVIDFDNYGKTDTDKASRKGGVVRRPAGIGREEASVEAVLMCIPRELFEEIKQEEYDRIAEKKKALKSGVPSDTDKDSVDGLTHYAPRLSDGGTGYSETTG